MDYVERYKDGGSGRSTTRGRTLVLERGAGDRAVEAGGQYRTNGMHETVEIGRAGTKRRGKKVGWLQ